MMREPQIGLVDHVGYFRLCCVDKYRMREVSVLACLKLVVALCLIIAISGQM